jgi:hypothetical protein
VPTVTPAPEQPTSVSVIPAEPSVPWIVLFARVVTATLVVLLVAFHLVVLVIRNPLDLWDKEIREELADRPRLGGRLAHAALADPDDPGLKPEKSYWDSPAFRDCYHKSDRFTWKYTNFIGLEQRWTMFSPPMARKADFLAIRLEFSDGSSELMLSQNEPSNPNSFFRIGGWQVRKLEDYLAYPGEGVLTDRANPERKLWEAFARHAIVRWHSAKPGDPREIDHVVFVRRRVFFLDRVKHPGQRPEEVREPEHRDIAAFDKEGRVLPWLP